jgi:subfamily B ATP-binding cassette protein MsbA
VLARHLGESYLKVIILVGTMFYMDARFSILILIFMPVAWFMLSRQRRKMRKSTSQSLQETGDLSALITQTLRGMRIVRAYRQEDKEQERAASTINRALEFTMRGTRARAMSSPSVELLTGLGFALAIYFAGTKGVRGDLTLGHFMGFMTAALLIYTPLKSAATLQTQLQEGIAAASRVFGIIDREIVLDEAPDAKPLKLDQGEIEFRNVSFAYDPETSVLKGVSLTVPPGRTVALVGPSGSGKSTLVNLTLRFFDPDRGKVLIDGQDIKHVTIDSLRDAIALVTQDPVLFDDTIRANIAYGSKPDEESRVIEAAKAAAAHDFIAALPKGYDTRVGEAGGLLSGGERQRIAIARALYKDAPILLLDEPTSSLDSEAEAKVQAALEELMRGRTVLMIAHRLSTVKKADLICVLDQGRIIETGRQRRPLHAASSHAIRHRRRVHGPAAGEPGRRGRRPGQQVAVKKTRHVEAAARLQARRCLGQRARRLVYQARLCDEHGKVRSRRYRCQALRRASADPCHVARAVPAPADAEARAAGSGERHGLSPRRCRSRRRGPRALRYRPDQGRRRRQETPRSWRSHGVS